MTDWKYRDVFEFQEKHPSREEREQVLRTLGADEIMHIARSCGTKQGGAYYARFAQEAVEKEKFEKGGVFE